MTNIDDTCDGWDIPSHYCPEADLVQADIYLLCPECFEAWQRGDESWQGESPRHIVGDPDEYARRKR